MHLGLLLHGQSTTELQNIDCLVKESNISEAITKWRKMLLPTVSSLVVVSVVSLKKVSELVS